MTLPRRDKAVKRVLVSTYGRAVEKLNVARNNIGYDKLVLVCDGKDRALPQIRRSEEDRGSIFEVERVDPYNFEACLRACSKVINQNLPREISFNISCGPKTLVGAAMFAAYLHGIPVYHCDVVRTSGKGVVIPLPTIRDFELKKRFNEDDWRVLQLLGDKREHNFLARKTGLPITRLDKALSRLRREGLLDEALDRGRRVLIIPTVIGRFLSEMARGCAV
jgi:hypothetical protein